jgi:MinD superfamily P-loop ATPase
MKEIVIISGKGGVGKSAVAASLGVLLAQKYRVLMADTDVDAPNLHLVLGAKLAQFEEIAASTKAFIDTDKCSHCLTCVDLCRFAAILGDSEPIMIPYSCEGCGACVIGCPEEAISLRQVVNGRINLFEAGRLELIGGELAIGASSSGRIVDLVRTRARERAESLDTDIIVTDGPPGIGCPVIAALKGADYALLVTEPTPAALSDLKRVVQVCDHFGMRRGLVVNKADIHAATRETLHAYAAERGLAVLAEIPYDKNVAVAIAAGRPVVELYPEAPASRRLADLADRLATFVESSSVPA